MIIRNLARWLTCLAALGMMAGHLENTQLRAEDKPAAAEPAAEGDEPSAEADPFAVPEDATPEELLEFVDGLMAKARQGATSQQQFIENVAKAQAAAIEAAEQVLADEKATDEQAVKAVRAKIGALNLLENLGQEDAAERRKEFTRSLKDDKRPAIVELMKYEGLAAELNGLGSATKEEKQAFVKSIQEYLADKQSMGRQELMLVMRAGSVLERTEATELAAKLYGDAAKVAAGSDDEQVQSYAKRLEGMVRRVTLKGNEMDVFGPLLGGEEINWKDYRGKVVLVDFWATWCGPCLAEMPNIKKNYEQYHGRGFDVIGISLDNDKEKLEKFVADQEVPWPIVYDDESAGWENPLAQHYGISAIPAAILVDQQGKVIDLHARGPALGQQLEKLLGPAEESEEPAKEDAAEAQE